MVITNIFSFLVHAAKGLEEPPDIGGTDVPLMGRLCDMLKEVFDRSELECKTEISFDPSAGGQSQNDCRDELIALLQRKNIVAAKELALRLQSVTTKRSGLGLLFIVLGKEDNKHKALISRFPADVGVLAEENRQTLTVSFLERVFMKNAASYKAALYSGESFDSDFWDGSVVDRQLHANANYWIREFLLSNFKTTAAAGTQRLAEALRHAMNSTGDLAVKEEIYAATRLAYNSDGQRTSIDAFCNQYNLSQEARRIILSKPPYELVRSDEFLFSTEEFGKTLPYRSIELDNGAIMTAQVRNFEDCFDREDIPDTRGKVRFTTQGRIVDEVFRKRKI